MVRSIGCVVATVLLGVLGGCAPGRFVEGVRYTAEQSAVASATARGVAGHGYLRFDHQLLSELDDAIAADDVATVRGHGAETLRAAQRLAVTAADGEIDRMPPEALAQLVQRYHLAGAPDEAAARRAFLKAQFAADAQRRLSADLARLEQAETIGAAQRMLRGIRRSVEPPAGDKGKLARALLGAPLFVPAAIGAEIADEEATQRVMTADFAQVAVYEPPSDATPPSAGELEQADAAQLAAWFAPVIVQQVNHEAAYPAEDDHIGRVRLAGTQDQISVQIDDATPVVYWAHQEAKVGRERYDQLVYVAWYPARPAMQENDPTAGDIDGVVIRVTLDRHHRPAVYEFVRSCGCYHTLWVAEFVEAEARAEFGAPAEGQTFAVQRSGVKRELFMPALVKDDGSKPHRPIALVSAGYHLMVGIHPVTAEPPPGEVVQRATYALEPYETLTHLPLGEGVASMFGSDGLVHNAGRAEGWLLAPTGMLSAGQPRQLGTMKIRMDAYDYDDPRLLERNLRLPAAF